MKLAFWKRNDDLGLPSSGEQADPMAGLTPPTMEGDPALSPVGMDSNGGGLGTPMPNQSAPTPGSPASLSGMPPSQFQSPPQSSPEPAQGTVDSRDMQLIMAKLDSIKASMDAVTQRLERLEQNRQVESGQSAKKYDWYQ